VAAETDTLTAEQLNLWGEAGMDDIQATAGQTREQAVNFAIHSYRYICNLFDGEPIPSEAAVRNELDRRDRAAA
jgi:hypothetical protein